MSEPHLDSVVAGQVCMTIAFQMLAYNRVRFCSTVFAIAALFLLSTAQIGLLVGWCQTTSAIIRYADADLWVMARQTPAFDYGTAIPRSRIYQVRSVEGVEWAEGLFMAWNTWQRRDGRRLNVELIGLDSSCVAGPWSMADGILEDVHLPDRVVVDELFLDQLGVAKVGDEGEMYGRRARVAGISRDVRTFTASPFVFTSLQSARKYDKRYGPDEVTYVLARCASGESPEQLCERIRRAVPSVEVLTSEQFAWRTVNYWMLGTGIGITVVVTAVLGFLVSTVITYQALYSLTQENLVHYATLFAIGFGRGQLLAIVLSQAATIGSLGISIGSILFTYAAHLSRRTPLPLETTTTVSAGMVAISLGTCVLASVLSMRSVSSIDPVSVFRA